ncbi:MAG TPA: DUF2225 domain-containing protein [Leptospiraceae bacterium]|nr:DUF2225 domain-containing protein [Leptospiraceae bacterium]HMW03456.1 DUF2225 domain-containing protein [Leptospiraceae bacterium]HMX31589.1 DUF2225 domain-containing protein [Leptospiraceae bacterium]HMY29624.1 DUF2225 domain-containing protein [Leptospiraceae bacterium]HMZ62886.1 DUF2225 domain-containing protein [Leptospiraceae bacterium]
MSEHSKGLSNPVMTTIVTCPICFHDDVFFYSLKAKSLASRQNVFSIPIYLDTPKYVYVDFNDYSFSVCPHCYFTSNRKQDFIYTDSIAGTKNKSTLLPKIIEHWTENKKEVEDLLIDNFVDENSFKEPRTDEGIISSSKLGIYKTNLEILYKVPYSHLKRARAYLKLFYTIRKLYKNEDESILKKALEDLEYVFKESDFPEISYEYEVLYLISAIYMRLGDEANTTQYFKVFDKTKSEVLQKAKANPQINTHEVTHWLNRAKNLWQDRSDNMVWEVLNPWPRK